MTNSVRDLFIKVPNSILRTFLECTAALLFGFLFRNFGVIIECFRGAENPTYLFNFGMNPVAIYQRYQRWREKEQKKCTVTINEPKMRIKGKFVEPVFGLQYMAFLGIPYALPPIGPLRFAPPQPLPRKPFYRRAPLHRAYKQPDCCLQYLDWAQRWTGTEDCLYLNVFIPTKPERRSVLLPVIVFIHGGGFDLGSTDRLHPSILIPVQKCIVVAMHYRLNLLGFLNMRSDNCRGNAGLKDQVMALKWVRDNIQPFGGDPHNVTIAGHSAGGSSVNLHMISPLSKGLFHKAIVQAGGIYCPWGYGDHVDQPVRQLFKQNGRILENELIHVLIESLKSVAAEDFLKLSSRITNDMILIDQEKMKVLLSPSVEYIQEDAFLPDTAENLMLTAEPVPTIAGFTKQEGYQFYRGMKPSDVLKLVTRGETWTKFLKGYLHWSDESIMRFFPRLKAIYFPEEYMSDTDVLENFATLFSDICFRRFYDNFRIGNLSKSEPPALYIYKFNYFLGVPIIPPPEEDGVCIAEMKAPEHGDDMRYVLCVRDVLVAMNRISNPKERWEALQQTTEVMYSICELWASFCRTGVPKCSTGNVKWGHHTEEDPCYLSIGSSLSLRHRRLNKRSWEELNSMCQLDKLHRTFREDIESSNMRI